MVPGPEDRSWGFAVQLYSLRSRQSWGHGDLGDLADLAAWSASDLGAGFILINPLHAGEPLPPLSQSPYLPMSLRFTSPLYLRIEDIPEYAKLTAGDRVRIDSLAAPLRARNATSELLNRDEVWQAKRAALQIIYRQPMTAQRRAEFDDYRHREGQSLQDWGLWCALAEIHGPDWRAWPEPLRAVGSAEVAAERDRLAGQALFHAWLQWLADGQLASAQEAARAAGMRIGIIRGPRGRLPPRRRRRLGLARRAGHRGHVGAPPMSSTSAARTGTSRPGIRSGWRPSTMRRWRT